MLRLRLEQRGGAGRIARRAQFPHRFALRVIVLGSFLDKFGSGSRAVSDSRRQTTLGTRGGLSRGLI